MASTGFWNSGSTELGTLLGIDSKPSGSAGNIDSWLTDVFGGEQEQSKSFGNNNSTSGSSTFFQQQLNNHGFNNPNSTASLLSALTGGQQQHPLNNSGGSFYGGKGGGSKDFQKGSSYGPSSYKSGSHSAAPYGGKQSKGGYKGGEKGSYKGGKGHRIIYETIPNTRATGDVRYISAKPPAKTQVPGTVVVKDTTTTAGAAGVTLTKTLSKPRIDLATLIEEDKKTRAASSSTVVSTAAPSTDESSPSSFDKKGTSTTSAASNSTPSPQRETSSVGVGTSTCPLDPEEDTDVEMVAPEGNIGFCGLGQMGSQMLRRIYYAGKWKNVYVHNRTFSRTTQVVQKIFASAEDCGQMEVALGGKGWGKHCGKQRLRSLASSAAHVSTEIAPMGTLQQLALACKKDTLVMMLRDDEATETTVDELLAQGFEGTFVNCATLSPECIARLQKKISDACCISSNKILGFVNCAVTGRPDSVQQGELRCFISTGGSPIGNDEFLAKHVAEKVAPCWCKDRRQIQIVSHTDVTASARLKLASNFLIYGMAEVLGETMNMVDAAGLNRDFVASFAKSLFPNTAVDKYAERMVKRDFALSEKGSSLGLAHKDMKMLYSMLAESSNDAAAVGVEADRPWWFGEDETPTAGGTPISTPRFFPDGEQVSENAAKFPVLNMLGCHMGAQLAHSPRGADQEWVSITEEIEHVKSSREQENSEGSENSAKRQKLDTASPAPVA
ncbi:unnamed protein product [Amoebophrya sp. A25]|nr:unnamed protein product [Amoebophrya sp. A25]|eukprot:GSA25T00005437001.1